jgi:hypothetical protein
MSEKMIRAVYDSEGNLHINLVATKDLWDDLSVVVGLNPFDELINILTEEMREKLREVMKNEGRIT